jgi:alpha-tubulin suppressor-like RCC1 family protein
MPTFYNFIQDGIKYSFDEVFVNVDAFKEGELLAWGRNHLGQLGLNDTTDRITPVPVFGGGNNWRFLSSGGNYNSAIKTDGTLWGWGTNGSGQLGVGDTTTRLTPVQIFGGGNNWTYSDSGSDRTFASKTDGTLWSWGNNNVGQLGINTSGGSISTPVTTFAGGTNWILSSSFRQSLTSSVIKTDGTLWVWGGNSVGQLGIGDTIGRFTPVTTALGGNDWKGVGGGSGHIVAVKTNGTLWSWGLNDNGQLGIGDTSNRILPTQVGVSTDWNRVYTTAFSSFAIKTNGTLWCWGLNDNGQLGIGDTIGRFTPVEIFGGGAWKQVKSRGGPSPDNHTIAIKVDGSLWVWGGNQFGQLGTGDYETKLTPVTTVLGGNNWKDACGSRFHTVAIRTTKSFEPSPEVNVDPDGLPSMWASRLTTAGQSFLGDSRDGCFGSVKFGEDGVSFHTFWFPVVGETGVRVVVIKRLSDGTIVWQKWSTSTFSDSVSITGVSDPPKVLPMEDGGCVVTAQAQNILYPNSTGTPYTHIFYVWKITGDGYIAWAKEYQVNSSGAYDLKLNENVIVLLTSTTSRLWLPGVTGFNRACPALLRINASDGTYINGRAFVPIASDNSNSTTNPNSEIIVLPNGRIVFKSIRQVVSSNLARVYLLEISADLSTIHANGGYSNNTVNGSVPYMLGPIVRLPDGGYLSRQDEGFIRFDSEYNIVANYRHQITISGAQNLTYDASLFSGDGFAMKLDANGRGFAFGPNSSHVIREVGIGIIEFGSSGATVRTVSEIGDGSGAGELGTIGFYDIDNNLSYGGAALVGRSSTSCYLTTLGFKLKQPISGSSTSVAARTLNTGSCGNVLTSRGWDPPGTSLGTITFPFTKYPITVQSGVINLVSQNTSSNTMVDASGSLNWTLTSI